MASQGLDLRRIRNEEQRARIERFRALTDDARLRVDEDARGATATIPIVFALGADPVQIGLVASLRQPGGNVTGITQLFGELGAKRLELLLEIVPQAASVGVLVNRENPNTESHLRNIAVAARAQGREIAVGEAASADAVAAAFAGFAARAVGGVLIADDSFFFEQGRHMIALAERHRLPTVFFRRVEVEAGGLISYGPEAGYSYRQAGIYAARILAGAAPATLPVLQAASFELVVNLRAARALGLTIPAFVIARADEVIE
jgi:putative ABC transport system substrate-binding protein